MKQQNPGLTKMFFFKDKTGRGITSNLSLARMKNLDNETSWDDEELHEWAENAEQGDEWENECMKFTCTKA